MADETLLVAIPQGTKIRTDSVVMNLRFEVIDANGTPTGLVVPINIRAEAPGAWAVPNFASGSLNTAQRTAVINFAKQAAQVAGLIA